MSFEISGTVLDTSMNGYPTSGRHASLMASSRSGGGENGLREGLLMSGTLTGQKVNYLDSGYSEEDPSEQPSVTSCLVKTSSGSVYIPPNMPKNNTTMDSRLEYRFGGGNGGVGGSMHSPSSHSPTKESLKNSERSTLQYTSSDTPFLPVRNNLQGPSLHSSTLHTSSSRNGNGVGTMSGLSGILYKDSKNIILLSHK